MHTSTFSDWIPTRNELVQFAWTLGLKEIAITDHSQACLDIQREKKWLYMWTNARRSLKRRENVFNDVQVIAWVEGDILNEQWDCCFSIQGIEYDFIVLSAHKDVYASDPDTVTAGTIKAIERYHDRIVCIGHPCNNADFGTHYDIEKLVEVANAYNVPLEFNAKNLMRWKTHLQKLHYLLQNADRIYLNSDAHTLYELKVARSLAKEFLLEHGYIASLTS